MLLLSLHRPQRGKTKMGVGNGGLGRQNTIMQRSVGIVLPTSSSNPPANANMRAKASTFASLPSPSVSSPTAPAVARPCERPKLAPAPVHVRLFLHAHNLHLAHTHVPPRRALRPSSDQVSCWRDQYDHGTDVDSDMWFWSTRTTQRMTFLSSRQLS